MRLMGKGRVSRKLPAGLCSSGTSPWGSQENPVFPWEHGSGIADSVFALTLQAAAAVSREPWPGVQNIIA